MSRQLQSLRARLGREITIPRFVSEAGDLATAAVVVGVREWRFLLQWTALFGLPVSILVIASGREHPGWSDSLSLGLSSSPILESLLVEPWMAAVLLLYLASRRDQQTFSWLKALGTIGNRAGQILLASAVLAGLNALVWLAYRLGQALLGGSSLLELAGPALAALVIRTLFILALPLVVLERMPASLALRRSPGRSAGLLPAVVLAGLLLLLPALLYRQLILAPSLLLESDLCRGGVWFSDTGWPGVPFFCSVWLQAAYFWLLPLLAAPLHALAYLTYQETCGPRRQETPP